MSPLKRNFTYLMCVLLGVMVGLILLSTSLARSFAV